MLNLKRKSNKIIKTISLLGLMFLFSSCGNNNATPQQYNEKSYGEAQDNAKNTAEMAEDAGVEGNDLYQSDNLSDNMKGDKIIKNAMFMMETDNFEGIINKIKVLTSEQNGYVEANNSNLYLNDEIGGLKNGSIIIRIPTEKYEYTLEKINSFGKVIEFSESSVNENEKYYDISGRLEIKKVEEERLLSMISKTQKIEELLQLEKMLSEVRTTIELFQSQLNAIDKLAKFSTINITLKEVTTTEFIKPISNNLLEKMNESFKKSVNSIIKFLELLIILLFTILPFIGLIAVVFIITKIFKRIFYNKK